MKRKLFFFALIINALSSAYSQGSYGGDFRSVLGEVNRVLQDPSSSEEAKGKIIMEKGRIYYSQKKYKEADSIFALAWKYGLENTPNLQYHRAKTNDKLFEGLKKSNKRYISRERKLALQLFEGALDHSSESNVKYARESLRELEKSTSNDIDELISFDPAKTPDEEKLELAGQLTALFLKHYPRAYPYEWRNRKEELNNQLKDIYLSIAIAYQKLMKANKDVLYTYQYGGKTLQGSKATDYYRKANDFVDKALALDIYDYRSKNFKSNLRNSYDEIVKEKQLEKINTQEKELVTSSTELSSLKEVMARERMELDSLLANKEQLTQEVEAKQAELEEASRSMEEVREQLGQTSILLENQRLISIITGMAAVLILVLGVFAFRGFVMQRKQTKIIEKNRNEIQEQHLQLSEKNREITDSIVYAKRIQSAIMPPVKLIKQYLSQSFVFYEPKDVVAGDFYWFTSSKDAKGKEMLFLAAADCTGHGVPGALVSVVCNSALNRAVKEFKLEKPGDILSKTRELVMQEFEKSDEVVRDGMDIALCRLQGNQLQFAGANNPLWIIRKGADEVEIIEPHKQAIGMGHKISPYPTHKLELQQGDTFYIFSDGFADQFGGGEGKKFKAPRFRELLLSIQDKSMDEQKNTVVDEFHQWKGRLEQIDDVCVIGVRI